MAHGAALVIVLAFLWWVLSGHTERLVLAFGAVTIVIAVLAAWRMRLIDREGVPFSRIHRRVLYWLWLGGEIVKANVAVVRLALRPELDITPRLVRLPARQATVLGRAVFANSITLTPGTVSVDVEEGGVLVHALDASLADSEDSSGMGARVAAAFDTPGRR